MCGWNIDKFSAPGLHGNIFFPFDFPRFHDIDNAPRNLSFLLWSSDILLLRFVVISHGIHSENIRLTAGECVVDETVPTRRNEFISYQQENTVIVKNFAIRRQIHRVKIKFTVHTAFGVNVKNFFYVFGFRIEIFDRTHAVYGDCVHRHSVTSFTCVAVA